MVESLFSDKAAKRFQGGGLGPEQVRMMVEGWLESTFRGKPSVEYCMDAAEAGLIFAKARIPLLIVLTRLPLVTEILLKLFPRNDRRLVSLLKALLVSMRVIAVSYEAFRQRIIKKMRETMGISDAIYNRL
uniref:Uncharacterized protein n=1 Tax=Thermofilum pendens TaxID=2269 RepID=A0A7C1T9U1_THEPE